MPIAAWINQLTVWFWYGNMVNSSWHSLNSIEQCRAVYSCIIETTGCQNISVAWAEILGRE
jgi:hypothetical protein